MIEVTGKYDVKSRVEGKPVREWMQGEVKRLLDNYNVQSTPEARFVKAVDKVEVIFEVLDDNYISIFKHMVLKRDDYRKTKLQKKGTRTCFGICYIRCYRRRPYRTE